MSAPRTKRQFAGAAKDPSQRQITSFFGTDGRVQSNVSTLESRGDTSGIGPAPPAAVQSSLLSVGMRIRKSVPEGYKTGTYKLKPETPKPTQNVSYVQSAPIGLVPFCGVNKIGGLSTQPMSIEPSSRVPPTEVPSLSSSQETINDEDEEPEQRENKKRSHSISDDFEEFPGFESSHEHTRGPEVKMVYPDRIMAIPRKSNPVTVNVVDDFDEAPFLDSSIIEEDE